MIKIYLQGGTQKRSFPDGTTKADMARALLAEPDMRFSVTEVSQALGAAYSQIHSIAKKEGLLPSQSPERRANIEYHTGRKVKPMVDPKDPTNTSKQTIVGDVAASRRAKNVTPVKPIAEYAGGKRPTSKARVAEAKEWAGKRVDAGLDALGSFGRPLPSKDAKKLGKCTNCGYDLQGRKLGGQMQMIHVGGDQEAYLNTIQFCHAYPASL